MNKEKILLVDSLKKSYRKGFLLKKIDVLKGVSFSAKKGEILSILGPNGAGKTTTFKIIVGISKPDEGKILLDGEKISLKNKNRLGFLPEQPYFYDYLTGKEYLEFIAGLFSIKNPNDKIDEVLKIVEMEKYKDLQLQKYSKGMLQRIGIAQAILNNPDVLILDEPLSGLDPVGRKKIKELILKMKEKGKTIIFSSHILQDAEVISDRVAILYDGKIVKEGTVEELLKEEKGEVEVAVSGIKALPDDLNYKRFMLKENTFYITFDETKNLNRFIKKAIELGGSIQHVIPSRKSLEEIFEDIKDETQSSN